MAYFAVQMLLELTVFGPLEPWYEDITMIRNVTIYCVCTLMIHNSIIFMCV
jgi:hypothetical protein